MIPVRSAPRVFADTNILYGGALRDILIDMAIAGAIELRWSPTVLDELCIALVRNREDYTQAKALKLVAAMTEVLPEALVIPPDDARIVGLPDAGDEHVVGAATHGECDLILTFNLADFPAELVAPVAVGHPDAFLLEQVAAEPTTVIGVIDHIRRELRSPPMDREVYCDGLARAGLPHTAELMRHLLPDA